jgi:hypothetical protein
MHALHENRELSTGKPSEVTAKPSKVIAVGSFLVGPNSSEIFNFRRLATETGQVQLSEVSRADSD